MQDPLSGELHRFDPVRGSLPWVPAVSPSLPEYERSRDCFAGHSEALPPALLRRPLAVAR